MITFFQGIICLIISIFLKYKPPKEMNSFYGFRTNKSMKNQESWNKAQKLFEIYLKKFIPFQIIIGILILVLEYVMYSNSNKENILTIIIIMETIPNFLLLIYIVQKINNKL